MRILAGTSGYAYKEWKGSFYPSDLPNDQMLSFYARQFGTVEINNTFYRLPSSKVLLQWAEQVPPDFTFILKASQRITHRKRLKDAEEPLSYLLQNASLLESRLGPILFQLPPNLKLDLARLRDFLAVLPAETRAAFEFRHPSWFADDVYDALRERGAALCIADTDEDTPAKEATAAFGYLRLRREHYGPAELGAWGDWVRAQPWDTAFVFFKHEDAGAGPALAKQFLEVVGG
jgi:uncharacterized protein YecE (DUF72 family)